MKLAKGSTPWISVPIFITAALAAAGSWHMSALALAGSVFMIFFTGTLIEFLREKACSHLLTERS